MSEPRYWLVNRTAYKTGDLRKIVTAFARAQKEPLPDRLTVAYYTPSSDADASWLDGTSLFVKFQRTGDVHSKLKTLGLVRPSKLPLDELVLMAVLHRGEAPEQMLKQLWWRLHMLFSWVYEKGPSWWDIKSRRIQAESSYKEQLAQRGRPFRLRFARNERGPTREEVKVQLALAKAELLLRERAFQLSLAEEMARNQRRREEDARMEAVKAEHKVQQWTKELEEAQEKLGKLERQHGLG